MIINNKTPVGEVRPSQLLWTYGPGALIDLPSLSVVTLGIDRWERIAASRFKRHGCSLPSGRFGATGREPADAAVPEERTRRRLVGRGQHRRSSPAVPALDALREVRPAVALRCGAVRDQGEPLQAGANPLRPQGLPWLEGRPACKDADAVPARFLLACRDGHLDDFPWHYFVHGGNSSCKGTLRFFESGASLQTENLWVKCDAVARIKKHGARLRQGGKRESAWLPRAASSPGSLRHRVR
jgi:hypothetical protein